MVSDPHWLYFRYHTDAELLRNANETGSVADLHHLDADPDPACHFDADQDTAYHFDASGSYLSLLCK
jgi:hypothetical protein